MSGEQCWKSRLLVPRMKVQRVLQRTQHWLTILRYDLAPVNAIICSKSLQIYMGSGNESEIFDLMLHKSTYLTKISLISMQIYKMFSWIFIFGHNAKDLSRHGCRSPYVWYKMPQCNFFFFFFFLKCLFLHRRVWWKTLHYSIELKKSFQAPSISSSKVFLVIFRGISGEIFRQCSGTNHNFIKFYLIMQFFSQNPSVQQQEFKKKKKKKKSFYCEKKRGAKKKKTGLGDRVKNRQKFCSCFYFFFYFCL